MVYTPTYMVGDLPAIGADAIGTAGAAAVPLIPLAVTAGALYGGAVLTKKAFQKGKGKKGWHREYTRHSLARKGIKTKR
jgi:hypothetical protein